MRDRDQSQSPKSEPVTDGESGSFGAPQTPASGSDPDDELKPNPGTGGKDPDDSGKQPGDPPSERDR
ncbi:hypothetical protein BH23CHL5_BH23CHL5_24620 [soil metagenome]